MRPQFPRDAGQFADITFTQVKNGEPDVTTENHRPESIV